MNRNLWKQSRENRQSREDRRSRRIYLAIVLGAATLGILAWWTASTQVTLADDPPLSGSVKAVAPSVVQPGDSVTYTIVLSNSSAVSDVNVLLTDPLHSLLDYVEDSARTIPDGSGSVLAGTAGITWTVTVSPATSVMLTFQAQVGEGAGDGTLIANTATISDSSTLVELERGATVTVDLSPTSQVWSPENGAIITEKGTLTVTGKAWDGDHPAFPSDPVLDPISNGDGDGAYYVIWTGDPSALNYTLEEANSPDFSDPTEYNDATSPKYIFGKAPDTYYYRVKAHNMDGDSRWSNVESVTVLQATHSPGFLSMLTMPAQVAASEPVTVWVRIDDGAWQTATVTANAEGWWDWSYGWSLSEEDGVQHTIQTQAYDTIGNVSAVDTITITMDNAARLIYFPFMFKRWPPIPYPPVLYAIANADGDGDYTVSWAYGYTDPPALTFTLQEATDADFSDPTYYYPGSATTQAISGKGSGMYYYRVQGNNTWGAGEWSDVKSVTVAPRGYRDDFDSSSSGWSVRRYDDLGHKTKYYNGALYTLHVGSRDFSVTSPMVEAPPVPYTIRTRTRVVSEHIDGRDYWPKDGQDFGIVFGGNGGSPCPADRNTPRDQGCLSHYYRLTFIWSEASADSFSWRLKRIDYHDPSDGGKGKGITLVSGLATGLSRDGWNEWKIEVTNSTIKVYVNNHYLGQTTDTRYINDPHFGFFGASTDFGDLGFKWDWFEIEAQ